MRYPPTLVDEQTGLWRGPRPLDLQHLVDLGIKRIVSLETGVYDCIHPDQQIERQFPNDFGMKQYDLSSSVIMPPERWAVWRFLTMVEMDRMPTYLHCLDGVDRTGYFCAVYRMLVNKWSYQAALTEWKGFGRHLRYFWWDYALKKWEKA